MGKQNIISIAKKAKESSCELGLLGSKLKNKVLLRMAGDLIKYSSRIKKANEKDLKAAIKKKRAQSFIDRLALSDKRIKAMAKSLKDITALEDPVGMVTETIKRPNGLLIGKMLVPIGVIAIIYEARPNVTSDCVGLCLKSGNGLILRGGGDAVNSNVAIFDVLNNSLRKYGVRSGGINIIRDTSHAAVRELLKQDKYIDVVIPRGGEALIREVARTSRIPVIKHYKGVCHVYVDKDADLKMAHRITINAKTQRPGVCNAMETLLVHKDVARRLLPLLADEFNFCGVELRGCKLSRKIVKGMKLANEKDWYTEYLDLILSVKVVKSIDEAMDHIKKYGSQHSDAIITQNKVNAARFLREVDSAAVYVNASTRFTDGGEFGMGAEMGISTDRLHARGPMALRELTTYKYIVIGKGQIRK